MASPAIGAKSYMQWGREATWGTPVAATKRLGIISHNVKNNLVQVKDPTLTGSLVQRNIYNAKESASGTIELLLTYNDLMMFFDCALGTATFGSNGGSTSGAGPFVHQWAAEKEFFSSLTIELIEGNIPSSKCQRLIGAKVKGFTITGQKGDICRIKLDIVAKQKQVNQTPTAGLTANSPIVVLTAHGNGITVGNPSDAAADIIIDNFELAFDSGMVERMDCSSLYNIEPIRGGVSTTTLKVRREFRNVNSLNDYIAGTSRAGILNFDSSPSSMAFNLDSAVITSRELSADGFGIMYEDITIEAIENTTGSSHGIDMAITNAQATITTV